LESPRTVATTDGRTGLALARRRSKSNHFNANFKREILVRKELRVCPSELRLLHQVVIMLILTLNPANDANRSRPLRYGRSINREDIPALTILMDWIVFDNFD
jgi:hypothetical protein